MLHRTIAAMLDALIARAADAEHQTPAERAAALNAAARLLADQVGSYHLPDPPEGWAWQDGRVVRATRSSVIPPLSGAAKGWGTHTWPPPRHYEPEEPDPPDEPPPTKQRRRVEPRPALLSATPRAANGSATVIEMASGPEGASVDEIVSATGLQPHSIRAILSLARRDPGTLVELDRASRRYRVSMLSAESA